MIFNKRYIMHLIEKNRIGILIKLLIENKYTWSIRDFDTIFSRLVHIFDESDNTSHSRNMYNIFYYMSEFLVIHNDKCYWNVLEWKNNMEKYEDICYDIMICNNGNAIKYVHQKTKYELDNIRNIDMCKYIVEKSKMIEEVTYVYGIYGMVDYVSTPIVKYMYTDHVMNLDRKYCGNHYNPFKMAHSNAHRNYLMSDEFRMRYRYPCPKY